MSYLTCIVDGSKLYSHLPTGYNEGFGSMMEYIVSAFIIGRKYQIPFIYTPMKNIGCFIHNNMLQEEWDKCWNEYVRNHLLFDLVCPDPFPEIINISSVELLKQSSTLSDKCFNFIDPLRKEYYHDLPLAVNSLPQLRDNYDKNKHILSTYFDENRINIAIHIRTQTLSDLTVEPERNMYSSGGYMQTFFINTIKRLNQLRPNAVFHIYSQGEISNFNNFLKLDIPINFHLDELPWVTLHHLIVADILVMSKSSFSYIASIYSKGIKLIRDPPLANILPEIIRIPQDGISFSI